MNKVKYKLNREWLNELLKHKTDSNVYFSLVDNDIRILLTYIDVLQSKIDKAIEFINNQKKTISKSQADLFNEDRDNKSKLKVGTFMWNVDELENILKGEDKD